MALDARALARFLQETQAPASRWIKSGDYDMYLRKSTPRDVRELRLERPLDLANVQRKGAEVQMEKMPVNLRAPRGKFRELMAMLETEAEKSGLDSVYVENIMNEFLPEVLASMNYSMDPNSPWKAIPSMYKRLR